MSISIREIELPPEVAPTWVLSLQTGIYLFVVLATLVVYDTRQSLIHSRSSPSSRLPSLYVWQGGKHTRLCYNANPCWPPAVRSNTFGWVLTSFVLLWKLLTLMLLSAREQIWIGDNCFLPRAHLHFFGAALLWLSGRIDTLAYLEQLLLSLVGLSQYVSLMSAKSSIAYLPNASLSQ